MKADLLGGTGMLAGCLGSDDEGNGGNGDTDTPTATPEIIDGAHVEGQTLIIPTSVNPEEIHFIWAVNRRVDSPYEAWSGLWRATHEMPIWGRRWGRHYHVGRDAMGESSPQLLEEFKIDGRELWVKIEDSATSAQLYAFNIHFDRSYRPRSAAKRRAARARTCSGRKSTGSILTCPPSSRVISTIARTSDRTES